MIYEELNWNVNLGHFKERIHRKEPLTSIIFGCIYQELDDCVGGAFNNTDRTDHVLSGIACCLWNCVSWWMHDGRLFY